MKPAPAPKSAPPEALHKALRKLSAISVREAPPGVPASFGMFDWEDWQDQLDQLLAKFTAALGGGPVQTEQAITTSGISSLQTVWRDDITSEAAQLHWDAVDAQQQRRLYVTTVLANALRIARDIAAVTAAGLNPLGAIAAARDLLAALAEVRDCIGL